MVFNSDDCPIALHGTARIKRDNSNRLKNVVFILLLIKPTTHSIMASEFVCFPDKKGAPDCAMTSKVGPQFFPAP
jgi:hypothetical protein